MGWLGKCFVAVFIAIIAGSDPAAHFTPIPVQAQPVEDPRWTQFTRQQDNLISNSVQAILATDGALWFGTDAGISRYTGEWTQFSAAMSLPDGQAEARQAESSAESGANGVEITVDAEVGLWLGEFAPPGETHALAVDDRGRIWAGTEQGHVAIYDGSGWEWIVSVEGKVLALAAGQTGTWIGTDRGLFVWYDQQLRPIQTIGSREVHALYTDERALWVGTSDGLWRMRAGLWAQVGSIEPWFDEGIYAIWVDPDQTLWVGTEYGVAWRTHDSNRWQRVSSLDEHGAYAAVQSLATDRSGALWAGTDGAGAFSFIRDQGRGYSYGAGRDASLGSRFVRGVAVDQDGSIWLATPVGVFRYQAHMWYTKNVASGMYDYRDFVNDLLLDDDGGLWIATGGAGVRYTRGVGAEERVYGPESGVPSWVFALAQDMNGDIWAGTYDGLLRRQGGVWSRPVGTHQLPGEEVPILLANGPLLWIGTNNGLSMLNLETRRIVEHPLLTGKLIEAIAADRAGNVWVGAEPGLYRFSIDGQFLDLHYHVPGDPESLPGGPVTTNGLAPDYRTPEGMWVNLRDAGLIYWDGERWKRDMMGEHVPGSLVWRLYSDPYEGSLWVGGEAGVSRFDGATWAFLTAQDGMQAASIHAIVAQEDGSYWMGGRNGVTYFRPDRSKPWIRVAPLESSGQTPGDQLMVDLDEPIYLRVDVGDLQTPAHRMKIIYRIGRILSAGVEWEDWQSAAAGVEPFYFSQVDDYRLEFQARDLSFNYSVPVSIDVSVMRPVALIPVPILGNIPEPVFRALAVLAILVVAGSLYISFVLFRHRRRSIEAVRRKFNPYISGEPVRRDDMFFGRRALVQRIVDTLHHNSIMIHGERRIGKTTLLYQLAGVLREVDDADFWFTPVYIDLEGTEQIHFFHYLMEEIYHGVETYLEIDIAGTVGKEAPLFLEFEHEDYTDREFNRDLRDVIRAIHAYGREYEPRKQARLILLLDEMDVVSGFDQLIQQQLRRIFMREFATTVGAVVAGIRISKAWDRVESPWFNLFNEIALEPFTYEQGRELLVEPVKGYYTYRPETIDFILEMAEGRPFRIQQYGLESVNQMLLAGRRTIHLRDAHLAHERLSAIEAAQILDHRAGGQVENGLHRQIGPGRHSLLHAEGPMDLEVE